MSTRWYNKALYEMLRGDFSLATLAAGNNLRLLFVKSGYVYSPTHATVSDLVSHESDATNYVRKTATITFSQDDVLNAACLALADMTWTELGGTTDNTIRAAILFNHSGGSDAARRLLAYLELPGDDGNGKITDGTDVTLNFVGLADGGNLRLRNV